MKLVSLFSAFLTALAAAETPFTDINYGHFEIHIDYTVTPGNPDAGWRLSPSYNLSNDFNDGTKIVRLDPANTVFLASPATLKSVPASLPRFGPTGAPFWILPQNNVLGAPFLGVRATMNPGIFQGRVGTNYFPSASGSVSLRLVSVTGTGPAAGGHFAAWETELNALNFYFDTSDGITAADEIPTVPVGAHTHYNWGMTRPGMYRVTFEAVGKLNQQYGGGFTSARQTFTFGVPFSGGLLQGAQLRVAEQAGHLVLLGADPGNSVAYRENQGFFEAGTAATAASAALPGALWEHVGKLSTAPAAIANGVGISAQAAAAGLAPGQWTDLELQLIGKRGPGEVALIENGVPLAGSAAGFASPQIIPLSAASERPLVTAFTASGIHHLDFRLSGRRNGQSVESRTLTLSYGAGITADYDYATWRDSWERSAGLAPGALANPAADYDGDGVPNSLEYGLAWHGFDPTRPDAHLLPRPAPAAGGEATIDFLRDTYKDRLDETRWKFRAGVSEDLVSWREISSRSPGRPLELWETGAEQGNAYGRIMQRRLRLAAPKGPKAFFRFAMDPPGA